MTEYDPGNLFDFLKERFNIKNDSELSDTLNIDPSVISHIRTRRSKISQTLIQKIQSHFQLDIREINDVMDPRRRQYRGENTVNNKTDTDSGEAVPATMGRAKRPQISRWYTLPADWRERLLTHTHKYQHAMLVHAVTGCLLEELREGVQLGIREDLLEARIVMSPLKKHRRQPWRILSWPVSTPSTLVRTLIGAVHNGATVVKIDNLDGYADALERGGKSEWPNRKFNVTRNCFQYAAAADMKMAGMHSSTISQALGYCRDVAYEYTRHAPKAGSQSVAPILVRAANKVE